MEDKKVIDEEEPEKQPENDISGMATESDEKIDVVEVKDESDTNAEELKSDKAKEERPGEIDVKKPKRQLFAFRRKKIKKEEEGEGEDPRDVDIEKQKKSFFWFGRKKKTEEGGNKEDYTLKPVVEDGETTHRRGKLREKDANALDYKESKEVLEIYKLKFDRTLFKSDGNGQVAPFGKKLDVLNPDDKEWQILTSEFCIILFSVILLILSAIYFSALKPIYEDVGFAAGNAPLACMVFSMLLLLTSCCGWVGEIMLIEEFKCWNIFVGLMLLGILVSGSSFVAYNSYYENVSNLEIKSSIEENILTYTLAVFQNCCSPENESPPRCDLSNQQPCFHDNTEFQEYINFVDGNVCGLFEKAGLVSKIDPESCAGQQLIPFIGAFMGYFIGYSLTIGIIAIVFSLISAFPLIFVLYKQYRTPVAAAYAISAKPYPDDNLDDEDLKGNPYANLDLEDNKIQVHNAVDLLTDNAKVEVEIEDTSKQDLTKVETHGVQTLNDAEEGANSNSNDIEQQG